VGGRLASGQYQYTLQGDDLRSLTTWARRLAARLRDERLIADVNTDQQDSGPDAFVEIDRDTAARVGVSAAAIDQTLYDAFGQRQVATLYAGLNQYRVVMEVAPEYWQHADTLNSVYVAGATGTLIPLSAVAQFGRSASALAVNHQSQFPAVTLSFNVRPGASLGDAVETIERPETSECQRAYRAPFREPHGCSRNHSPTKRGSLPRRSRPSTSCSVSSTRA
jgi:multidrug efflux pump